MQYDPSQIEHRPILGSAQKDTLNALAQRYTLAEFLGDARNLEETMVDFVYTSAKIEGNTYDRLDTDGLLRLGVTAGKKRFSDALMLLNLRDGFQHVIATEADTPIFSLDYVRHLHQMLMQGLLPRQEQGMVRQGAVRIGASSYTPPASAQTLCTEMQHLLKTAPLYDNPFERAIYLHCNLAYLQYFRDGNKRCARMMQTASMVQHGLMPLLFHEHLISDYQRTLVHYYESGEYGPYCNFFLEAHTATMELYAPQQQDFQHDLQPPAP